MGPVAAARRKLEIDRQLARETDAARASHLMDERDALVGQHPDIEHLKTDDDVDQYSEGREIGRRGDISIDDVDGPDPLPGGELERRLGRRPARGQRAPARAPRQRVARRRATATRTRGRSSKYFRQTGIPAATDSITRFIMGTAGALIGIALLYLLLTDAQQRGSGSAVSRIAGGFAGFVRNFVGQVDPLAKAKGDSSSSSTSGAQPGHPPIDTYGGGLLNDAASVPDPFNRGMLHPAPGVGNPPPAHPTVLPPGYRFTQGQLHPTQPGATAESIRAALGI